MLKPNTQPAVEQLELPRLQEHLLRETKAIKPPKERVLFLPSPVRSHIIPTLYIAELLIYKYDIIYAVTNSVLANLVSENGFLPVVTSTWQPDETRKQTGLWSTVYAAYTNELYHHRKRALDNLVAQTRPSIIIIDVFISNDFLALYSHHKNIKILFYNPMMSIFTTDIPNTNRPLASLSTLNYKKFSIRNFLKNARAKLNEAIYRYGSTRLMQQVGLTEEHRPIETTGSHIRIFSNVQELVLAPLEFELSPEVKKPHQHYLGLCVREARTDTELDAEFMEKWPALLTKKQAGQRIIYCSFGTYYTDSFKVLLDFVNKLLESISTLPNVQLVCSVNNLVIETLQAQQAFLPNTHFFRRVPQLVVLKNADVYITHGGLGSVKEGIYYGVPMLVYPLDLMNDQPSNGLKVEHHKLGLRGNFRWESASGLREKLILLLEDTTFQTNLEQFRETCRLRYCDNKIIDILINILKN